MSDARTDFFASGSTSTSKKEKPASSRDDFFAGSMSLDEVTPDKPAVPADDIRAQHQRGYGRGGRAPDAATMKAMRDADIVADIKNIPAGFNRGTMDLLGIPMDFTANVVDLAGMAYGATRGAIADKPASEFYQPMDRSQIPLTGDWNALQLDAATEALGMGPVTQPQSDTGIGRVLYGASAGIPSGLVGGGPTRAGVVAGAAGGGTGAVAHELGLDPGASAAASLLAGGLATRGMSPSAAPDEPTSPRPPPVNETPDAQAKLNAQASKQSMGAAGAAVDLQKLSPDLRVAVEKAVQQTGGAVNPEVLARQIQADSLPVKVRLSEGQALGDERLISLEQNARGKHEAYSKGFAEQNKALTENLRSMRDTTGPEVFSTNPVEHADTLIARYQAIDEAANAEISANYQALRDAAGGDFPVDTQSLLGNVRGALKKDLATSKAPGDVMAALEEHATSGKMTLEEYEAMRSSLARTQRTAADGQERHAAGVIREQLEKLPIAEGSGAAELKALADKARASARKRFEAMDADPAYKAAVNETVPPDRFVQKFVIGGTRDNVAKLSQAMAGDERAQQTVKIATLDHLRKAAGIDDGYNGNFTQKGYNKALQGLEPKLGSLLDPQTAETARNLGDVARYTLFRPEGSFVNSSNTFVAAAADKAADALEGVIDFKAGGIPIASTIRKQLNENKVRKQAEKTFAPGAGLTRLSDLTKLKKDKP
jgi:hypothetical protein